MDEYAENILAQRISMVSGVSQVFVYGSQKYAVRVQVNPDALASRNIGIDDVMRAVQQSNVNLPTGKLYGPKQSFTVQSSGQLTNAAAYKSVIVAYRDNNPVRLEDVAQVLDSVETDKSVAWINDTRGVILAIRRQPGTNTVEVVRGIRALLPDFRAGDPSGAESLHHLRCLRAHRQFHQRRQVDAGADHLPGGDGHLPIPAQSFGDADSGRGRTAVHRRHLRRDVFAGIQPEHSFADGSDAFGRLRRRRRHRDARKHRALSGDG